MWPTKLSHASFVHIIEMPLFVIIFYWVFFLALTRFHSLIAMRRARLTSRGKMMCLSREEKKREKIPQIFQEMTWRKAANRHDDLSMSHVRCAHDSCVDKNPMLWNPNRKRNVKRREKCTMIQQKRQLFYYYISRLALRLIFHLHRTLLIIKYAQMYTSASRAPLWNIWSVRRRMAKINADDFSKAQGEGSERDRERERRRREKKKKLKFIA